MSRDSVLGVLVFDSEATLQHVDAAAATLFNTDPATLLDGTSPVLQFSVTTSDGASYPSLPAYVEQVLEDEAAAQTIVLSGDRQAAVRVTYGPDGASGVVVTVHPPDSDRSVPHTAPVANENAQHSRQLELLRRTQKLAHVGGWTYNPETDAMKGTEETYRICEVPLDAELTFEQALSLYPPETASTIREAAQRCLRHGEPFDEEGPMVTAEGARRWVRVRGEARRDETGTIVRMVGTVQDLTERHAMEEQLREQKEWLRSITENVSGGLYRSTDEGLLYANRALVELFGYESLEEMTAADPETFYVNPEIRQDLIERETEEGGLDGVEVEYRRKDGSTFTGLLRSTPVEGADGTQYYDGIVTDITDQKTRERALREQREKMNALYETTERLFTADSRAAVANQIQHLLDEAFDYPLTGISFVEDDTIVPERVSVNWDYALPPIQELDVAGDSLGAQTLRSGERKVAENLQEVSNKIDYGDLQSAICIPIAEKGVIYLGRVKTGRLDSFDLHLIDVLAKKAATVLARIEDEQQLKAAKQEAEEASRLKSALLANMSHEIRTPLTSIIGFADMLRDDLAGQNAEYAERVHWGGQRLMDTLDSVLQLSKLEAGIAEPESESVDLVSAARQAIELHRAQAEAEQITLHFEPALESLQGEWDPTAIQRILSNLLSNAFKFTPPNGTVTVRVRTQNGDGVLTVADTGIGISDDFRPRLFDAFTQESEGLKREHEGSGLGLAIVKRLVDLMGGHLDVESTKGEGTCFRICLPRARTSPES